MGADWYSMTCIGLKVPREKIISDETEFRNLCSCTPPTDPDFDPSSKYCNRCGKSLRRPIKVDKLLFDAFADGYGNDEETKIMDWVVMHDTDVQNFYICIFTSGLTEYVKMSPMPNISEETLAKFNADMREVGLWDAEQFGLWTITYCSY